MWGVLQGGGCPVTLSGRLVILAGAGDAELRERLRVFTMTEPATPITITFRIPGKWSHPRELIQRLPPGCRVTGEALVLPDATQVELGAMPADDQFAQIFRSSCRQPATEEELATVDRYTVNILLSGPGGSMQAARSM